MKIRIKTLCALSVAVCLLTSCLHNDDDDSTLYNDMAITGFTLGTLNRYLHTLSSEGTDSVYKLTVAGSSYQFSIDQLQHLIFNTDSLPTGTDAEHILCNISTKNSGVVVLKGLDDAGTLTYYSASDSIDFSVPRELQVYATDGSGYETYTVKVNIHKEDADSFCWKQFVCADIPTGKMRAALIGEQLVIMSETTVTTFNTATQTSQQQNGVFSATAYKSLLRQGGRALTLDGGQLYATTDGSNWTTLGIANSELKQLVAASTTELYALSNDGQLMMSADNGQTWTAEAIEDATLLPTEELAYDCFATKSEKIDNVVLAGVRSATGYPEDTEAMVWRKLVDYSATSQPSQWIYLERSTTRFGLPRMKNLALVHYGDAIIAFGSNPDAETGNVTTKPFAPLCQSRDGGLTWKQDVKLTLPSTLTSLSDEFAIVSDAVGNVWIVCGGSNEIWRGRKNSVAWQEKQP